MITGKRILHVLVSGLASAAVLCLARFRFFSGSGAPESSGGLDTAWAERRATYAFCNTACTERCAWCPTPVHLPIGIALFEGESTSPVCALCARHLLPGSIAAASPQDEAAERYLHSGSAEDWALMGMEPWSPDGPEVMDVPF